MITENLKFKIFRAEKRRIQRLMELKNPENERNFLEVVHFQFKKVYNLISFYMIWQQFFFPDVHFSFFLAMPKLPKWFYITKPL